MVTGAAALCAAYAPEEDAYNRRNRLLTCVRPVESLTDLCITGGVLDVSKISSYTTVKTPDLTPAQTPENISQTTQPTGSTSGSSTVEAGSFSSSSGISSSSGTASSSSVVKVKKLKFKKKIKALRAGRTYRLKVVYTPSPRIQQKTQMVQFAGKNGQVSQVPAWYGQKRKESDIPYALPRLQETAAGKRSVSA